MQAEGFQGWAAGRVGNASRDKGTLAWRMPPRRFPLSSRRDAASAALVITSHLRGLAPCLLSSLVPRRAIPICIVNIDISLTCLSSRMFQPRGSCLPYGPAGCPCLGSEALATCCHAGETDTGSASADCSGWTRGGGAEQLRGARGSGRVRCARRQDCSGAAPHVQFEIRGRSVTRTYGGRALARRGAE